MRLVLPAVLLGGMAAAAVVWWRDRPLADIARRLEDPAGAPAALEAADAFLARRPGHKRALALRGRALAGLGRWDEASEIFSQVGARSPDEMRAHATALVNRRRWSEALPVLDQLLEREPDDPDALRDVTACRFQLGLSDAALGSASQLAAIDGHELDGLFLLGVIHRSQGGLHLALEAWERVERLRPDARGLPIDPAEFFLVYGEDLLAQGLPHLASAKLRLSSELNDGLQVQLRLGQARAACGDTAAAAAAWQRALEHHPASSEARHGLAELALHRCDGEEALEWLAPLAARPDVSSATANLLERAHTLLGNEADLEHWQKRTSALYESEKREAAIRRRLHSGL